MVTGLKSQNTQSKVTGYIQGPVVFTQSMNGTAGTSLSALGVKGGVKIEKKAFHAGGEIGIGQPFFQVKAEVGHKFNLNKNFNIDLAGVADYTTQLGKPNTFCFDVNYTNQNNETGEVTEFKHIFDESWNNNVINLGVKAEAQYSTPVFKGQKYPKINVGLGIEGGYRTTTLNDLELTTEVKYTDSNGKITSDKYNYSEKRSGSAAYITPTASFDVAISEHLSAFGDGSRYKGNMGIRYTF